MFGSGGVSVKSAAPIGGWKQTEAPASAAPTLLRKTPNSSRPNPQLAPWAFSADRCAAGFHFREFSRF